MTLAEYADDLAFIKEGSGDNSNRNRAWPDVAIDRYVADDRLLGTLSMRLRDAAAVPRCRSSASIAQRPATGGSAPRRYRTLGPWTIDRQVTTCIYSLLWATCTRPWPIPRAGRSSTSWPDAMA